MVRPKQDDRHRDLVRRIFRAREQLEYFDAKKKRWKIFLEWYRKFRYAKAKREFHAVSHALYNKYEGVLRQIHYCAMTASGQTPLTLKEFQSRWNLDLHNSIETAHPEEVPLKLWQCARKLVSEQFNATARDAIEPFKTKFLLRHLVDDLPSSDGRGVLVLLAYTTRRTSSSARSDLTVEAATSLDVVYRQLHDLLHATPDLDRITDGAIVVDAFEADRYDQWFFA